MKLEKYPKKIWFRSVAFALALIMPITDISVCARFAWAKAPVAQSPLSPDQLKVPSSIGTIQEVFHGRGQELVVHLQDAHGSVAARGR